MSNRKPIYVEIRVRAPMEELWEKTQEPQMHRRWDLRFTDIEYLPKSSPEAPQQFVYVTRIGFGMKIEGRGESVGSHESETGNRTSALKFWADDSKSLITTGSGYWKYVPTDDGIRFFTLYDYETRFGAVGALMDSILFRPIMGWATAWSFDRMRMWIEKGVPPETSLRQTMIHTSARLSVAFVWLWHGLVPKLIFHDYYEIAPILKLGFDGPTALMLVNFAGVVEITIAAIVLATWGRVWPLWFTAAAMILAFFGVLSTTPELFTKAFNPASTNVMLFAMSLIAIISAPDLPSAKNCLRKPPGDVQP